MIHGYVRLCMAVWLCEVLYVQLCQVVIMLWRMIIKL